MKKIALWILLACVLLPLTSCKCPTNETEDSSGSVATFEETVKDEIIEAYLSAYAPDQKDDASLRASLENSFCAYPIGDSILCQCAAGKKYNSTYTYIFSECIFEYPWYSDLDGTMAIYVYKNGTLMPLKTALEHAEILANDVKQAFSAEPKFAVTVSDISERFSGMKGEVLKAYLHMAGFASSCYMDSIDLNGFDASYYTNDTVEGLALVHFSFGWVEEMEAEIRIGSYCFTHPVCGIKSKFELYLYDAAEGQLYAFDQWLSSIASDEKERVCQMLYEIFCGDAKYEVDASTVAEDA